MSRSVDCNLSRSMAETVSSVTTTNQVDDPIVVTVARAGAVASCIPSLQGLQVRSLWDTGATLCLVDHLMSHQLDLERSNSERPRETSGNRWGRRRASAWSVFNHSDNPIQ